MGYNLDEIPTDVLRTELKRRVELEKSKKKERAKELKEIIKKSQEELRSLNVKVPQPKQERQIPNIVKQTMPKELRKTYNDVSEEISANQDNIQKSAASESEGNITHCPNCSATPSNWEYSERDGNVYCVCGQLIMTGDEIHGNFR